MGAEGCPPEPPAPLLTPTACHSIPVTPHRLPHQLLLTSVLLPVCSSAQKAFPAHSLSLARAETGLNLSRVFSSRKPSGKRRCPSPNRSRPASSQAQLNRVMFLMKRGNIIGSICAVAFPHPKFAWPPRTPHQLSASVSTPWREEGTGRDGWGDRAGHICLEVLWFGLDGHRAGTHFPERRERLWGSSLDIGGA